MKKLALTLAILVFSYVTALAQFSGIGAPGLGGGAVSSGAGQAQGCSLPVIAASVGFTNLTFCETWSNGYASIDMNDTRVQGFNWYVHNVFPNAPTQYVDSEIKSGSPVRNPRQNYIVVNNGTMSLSNITPNASDNWGNAMQTCAWDGSKLVGNYFGNGLYIDIVASFDASLGSQQLPCPNCPFVSDTFPGNWPTFWGDSTEFSSGSGGNTQHYMDYSIFEASPTPCDVANNTCQLLQAIQDIYPPGTSAGPWFYSSSLLNSGAIIPTAFPGWDYRQPHHYGMLWQTIAEGHVVGSFTFYVDGVQMLQTIYSNSGDPVPFMQPQKNTDPGFYPGQFSWADSQHMCFYLSDSLIGGNPITLGTVQVWQQPILYTTAPSNLSAYAGFQQAVPGITVNDNSTPSLITVNLSDSSGILTATGAGVSGSGTANLTVTGASTSAINTSLTTLAFTGSASDTIVINASDNAGNHAPPNSVIMSVSPECSQATNFLARTSGLTLLQQGAYVTMICGMVSDGDFQNLDAFYMYVTNSLSTLALNLVSTSFPLTLHGGGACTFTAFGGYQGDGATCYQDTGFNPAIAGGHYTLNAGEMGACEMNLRVVADESWMIGALDFTHVAGISPLNPDVGGALWAYNSSISDSGVWSVPTSAGSYAIVPFGTGSALFASSILRSTASAPVVGVPNVDVSVMALLNTIGASNFSSDLFGFAWIGGNVNVPTFESRARTFIKTVGGPGTGC